MLETFAGIDTFVNLVHPLKTELLIVFTLDGKDTLVRFLQL